MDMSRKADIPLQAARLSAVSLKLHAYATPHVSGTKQLVATSGLICVLTQPNVLQRYDRCDSDFHERANGVFLAIKKLVDRRAKHMKELVLRLIFRQKKRTTRRRNHFPS